MSGDTVAEPGLESAPSRTPQPPSAAAGTTNSSPFPPGTTHFPLTIAQMPIVLDALAMPNSPVANIGHIAQIDGYIDPNIFAEACRQVVAETPSLRAAFSYRDDAVVQEFIGLDNYTVEQHDCSTSNQPEIAAQAWIEEYFWVPLSWNSFPLFRLALIKLRNDRFIFVQKFHHGIIDATGRFQCFARIASVYQALIQGSQPTRVETPPLTSRIAEERDYLVSEAYQADMAYWKARLNHFAGPLIDIDRSRSERIRSGRSQRIFYDIGPEEFAHLKKVATGLGGSVPRLTLALTYIALSRLYDVNDIVVGFPFHNRMTEADKRAIDLQMTVMPFRMTFDAGITLAEMLKKIAALQVADRRHGRFPYASLSRMTGQHETGAPLFDVIVNYIPATGTISLGEAKVANNHFSDGFYTPLAVGMREAHDGMGAKLTIAFDPGLIDRDDGERLAKCLHFLLTNRMDFSQQTIGRTPITSDEERHHLLIELNDNDVAVPADATLASLCALQAERTPDAIAVTHGTQSLTYAQLHSRADILAMHLSQAGAGPETIVGVALPRGIDLIVSLLAIHKAGGAYLPLDTALPADRIAFMIADARARIVVTTNALTGHLPQTDATQIFLDDPALASLPVSGAHEYTAPRPENLAYVIYTSGSTGLPKGVAVEHRNVVNLVLFQATQLKQDDLNGILFSSSLNFDASIDELFVSLVSGGRLIIVETLLAYPAAPASSDVRVLEVAPSVFEALLQIDGFRPGIRRIRFGGEALSRSLVDRIFAIAPDIRIINSYGPTETTVDATVSEVCRHDSGEPPIGRGLWNTKLYVLDRNMQLMPKGAKGELYIGGAGVARGYLNRPELTAERFLDNPFGEGRIYRTGDIVRWRKDGELDYFNRSDDQVKINGLRIELGEIELQLESMPQIAQAVAVIRADEHGTKRIFAFAIARDSKSRPDISAVNAHLCKKLPKYMMPASLTWVEKFPLTQSGKLDRKALSLPQWQGPERAYRAPSSKDEISLAGIWSQVLSIPKIGIDDDFFELGGTSLQAVMIFAKISRAHGFDLPASTMVRAPTIALQAALLEAIWRENDRSLLVPFREKGEGAPVFFVHGGGGGVMHVRDLMQDLRSANPLYGLHAPALDGVGRLPRKAEEFATVYIDEIRKVQPQGPYHLIGFSAGGTIAHEMARQLQESGESVALLGLIETGTNRYRSSVRQARTYFLRRVMSWDINPFQAVKQIYGDALKSWKRLLEKAPNEFRHALGMAIPHHEREYFYMRWFRDVEAAYAPRLYRGPITLFASQARVESYRAMWSPLAVGGLTMRGLPVAEHSNVVLLPNSRYLAMQIDASLNELAANG